MAVVRIGSAEPPLFTAFIRDIGEKLRAQKLVRESEERLQRVIANLREGLIISDMEGELLDWNPAALEMHGITSADQCRFRLADCANTFELSTLDGTILPLEEWPLPRIVRGERLGDFEARLRRLGTDWERVLSYGGEIVDDPTWGQLAFVTIKDITEQRQTENARREADQHLTDIINSVEGIVWETDEETNRMTFISEKAEEILGYPTVRWLAEPGFWRSHMHPDDREKAISVSTCGNGHSQPTELEYRMVSAAGREVWFKDRVSVVKLPGRSVKLRGIMLDITHRKLADREARAGEARIREQAKLLDLAHDAIMVRDMEDRIEFWNHGAEKLYGWTAAEVHAKEAAPFLRKTDPAGAMAAWAAVIENGKWTGECKHICKDGGHVIVRSRWTLVRDDLGAPKSVLIINTDITEQKKIEEQFLRAQRLESIGTLASGVAHDLNNILAPILMGAAVLRRTEMAAADELILSTIETCSQRGADIVKQVLTFARGAEGARLLLQPAHLIDDVARIAQGTFPKTIAVRTNHLPSLWPIEGDPTQIHQVLLNLSVNARDAMPAGGGLTLSAMNFLVDEHYASMTPGAKAGPHVLFEVNDTGMGIPRQIIDQIFDPFFTTKEPGRGTGLGLSTAVGIVKGHGGFMSVESEIGRGTNFKIFFPAITNAQGTLPGSEAAAVSRANGELLLIVDDEKLILQVARELLEGHGYQVVTAGDAAEALAIFAMRKDEIKLVLTDLAMPLMDGIALIRTLRKMKPDVCVIASTGQGAPEQGAHVLSGLNVPVCLTKPYNKEMLLTTLRDALSPQANLT
jgi:PAS domain S-box-containing protein